jgi:thioredoxin-dependent peroxiredoxin
VEKKGARVVGISTDDVETQKKFKDELKVPYPLLSDKGGKVAELYGGKMAVFGLANRATFVVDADGTIKEIATGTAAIDPAGAITSCPIKKRG